MEPSSSSGTSSSSTAPPPSHNEDNGGQSFLVSDQDMFKTTLLAWICGCTSVFVGYPFDTIKVRLQLSEQKPTFRYLTKSLFRGVSSPVLAVPPSYALNFNVYAGILKLQESQSLTAVGIAGAISGFSNSLIVTPFEFAKVNVQRSAGTKSLFSVILAQKNPLSLYRGFGITLCRDALEGFGYFYTAESCMRSKDFNERFGWFSPVAAGACTGLVHVTLGYPFDAIKTYHQANPGVTYKETLNKLWNDGGIRRFYKGYSPSVLRACFAHGAGIAVMDVARKQLFPE